MPIESYSQLGMGIASLAILSVFLKQIVTYFITAIEKKDKRYEKAVKLFNTTINNHIVHETIARKKETKALTTLVKVIKDLEKKN